MALTTAFARNGNRKAVPQSTADGSVSYEQGFGNLYALPPEEGGLFIDRAQFNQLMYDTTSAVISNQNSISTLNSKVTANQSSINTLNTKVANIESNVSTGVVNLTGNQTISGVKTFSSPPVSATNPKNNNQVANKAYVDSVGNTAVKLTGNQTIAGTKTFSSPVVVPNATANTHAVNLAQLNTKANANATVNLTGNQSIAGVKTFSSPPVSATNPTANNQVANKAYVDSVATTLSNAGAKILTKNLVKTVGASGADFANLRQALEWASQYKYSNTYTITFNCNADMPIPGTYLPIGEAKIIIDGQNNSYNCDNNYFMAAAGNYSGNIIIQNFILNYNNITSTAYGSAFQFSSANYQLINVTININNSSIQSLIVSQRGYLHINNLTVNLTGNTTISNMIFGAHSAIIHRDNSKFNINVAQLTGSIANLFILLSGQSELYGTSQYPTDKINSQIFISQGAIVSIGSNFTDSKLSSAPNTVTSRGIIFKQ